VERASAVPTLSHSGIECHPPIVIWVDRLLPPNTPCNLHRSIGIHRPGRKCPPSYTTFTLSSGPECRWVCGPPKEMKMARPNVEWVAQVSKARPGPPTQSLVAALFSKMRSELRDLQFSLIHWSPRKAMRIRECSWPSSICLHVFGLQSRFDLQIPALQFTGDNGSFCF
jgi:hypothetical protein